MNESPLVVTKRWGVLSREQIMNALFLNDIERAKYQRALSEAQKIGILLVDEEGKIFKNEM